jgi:hypothetical protein
MTYSPVAEWADKRPRLRWMAVSCVLAVIVIGAYGLVGALDEIQERKDAEANLTQAERDSQEQRRKLQAVQDMSVGENGECKWADKTTIKCVNKKGREVFRKEVL